MIITNSRPGGLDYYLLHVAYLSWPENFDYHTKKDLSQSWTWDYNWCRPSLFHGDMSSINQDTLDELNALSGQPSIVMTRNIALIPNSVRDNSQIFTITYANEDEKAKSAFLSWLSNDGDSEIEAVQQNFQDPYQGYWQKLIIDIFDTPAQVSGTELRFAHLNEVTELQPFLDAVKQEYDLPDLTDMDQLSQTYAELYDRALLPIEAFKCDNSLYSHPEGQEYPRQYTLFQELWTTILATPGLSRDSYSQSLSTADVEKFKKVMDFMVSYSL